MNFMKRYAVFAAQRHSEGGGWEDFEGAFETLKEAKACSDDYLTKNGRSDHWADIVDLVDLKRVDGLPELKDCA